MKTVHAGEAYGPESIFQAITDLHADRIGHGTFLLQPEMIADPQIVDRDRYVDELAQYIADRRITMEICLPSNMQASIVPSIEDHPLRRLELAGVNVTLNTDSLTVSDVTLSESRACRFLKPSGR